jgi:hypothetical protein
MSTKATAVDAELILKLYDLRRESEMRKARNWMVGEFWPESVEDIMKIGDAMGTQENAWLRQVNGYWEMAASLVVHGALNQELFLETSFCGEMFFIFAKVQPFLKELRQRQNSNVLGNVEKVITSSEKGRNTLKTFEQRIAGRRKAMKEMAKAS